jgi:hypothetical protein
MSPVQRELVRKIPETLQTILFCPLSIGFFLIFSRYLQDVSNERQRYWSWWKTGRKRKTGPMYQSNKKETENNTNDDLS